MDNHTKPIPELHHACRTESWVSMRDESKSPRSFDFGFGGKSNPKHGPENKSHYSTAGSGVRNAGKRPNAINDGKFEDNHPPRKLGELALPWVPIGFVPARSQAISLSPPAMSLPEGPRFRAQNFQHPLGRANQEREGRTKKTNERCRQRLLKFQKNGKQSRN